MLLAYGHLLTRLIDQIDQMYVICSQHPAGTARKNIASGSMGDPNPGEMIQTARFLAKEISMTSVADQVGRLHKMVEMDRPLGAMAPEWWQLRVRLQEELTRKEFLFVPHELVDLYRSDDPFELGDKFKSAQPDIKSAAECLALSQGTACIFHLDRAMEVVLRQLAKRLKVQIGPRDTWGSVLNNMTPKIAKMPESNKREKDKKQAWSEARTHLFHVKECWRDRPAHGQESYSPARAKEIFEAVRIFTHHFAGL
jgi:hypothetical protein